MPIWYYLLALLTMYWERERERSKAQAEQEYPIIRKVSQAEAHERGQYMKINYGTGWGMGDGTQPSSWWGMATLNSRGSKAP